MDDRLLGQLNALRKRDLSQRLRSSRLFKVHVVGLLQLLLPLLGGALIKHLHLQGGRVIQAVLLSHRDRDVLVAGVKRCGGGWTDEGELAVVVTEAPVERGVRARRNRGAWLQLKVLNNSLIRVPEVRSGVALLKLRLLNWLRRLLNHVDLQRCRVVQAVGLSNSNVDVLLPGGVGSAGRRTDEGELAAVIAQSPVPDGVCSRGDLGLRVQLKALNCGLVHIPEVCGVVALLELRLFDGFRRLVNHVDLQRGRVLHTVGFRNGNVDFLLTSFEGAGIRGADEGQGAVVITEVPVKNSAGGRGNLGLRIQFKTLNNCFLHAPEVGGGVAFVELVLVNRLRLCINHGQLQGGGVRRAGCRGHLDANVLIASAKAGPWAADDQLAVLIAELPAPDGVGGLCNRCPRLQLQAFNDSLVHFPEVGGGEALCKCIGGLRLCNRDERGGALGGSH